MFPALLVVGNITPFEFFTGTRPAYSKHYSVARLQLMEVHVGKGPTVKKGSDKQLPYNSKQRFRTVPALCIQPTNAASNAYIYLNLATGKKIISHVATPRAYDDETRALIKSLDGSSVNTTSPTSLAETEIQIQVD